VIAGQLLGQPATMGVLTHSASVGLRLHLIDGSAALNRRAFIKSSCVAGALAVGVVSVSVLAAAPDEYGEFLQRVAARIRTITEREQRGVRRMWIDPPRVVDGRTCRTVHLQTNAGPSLLDKLFFIWDEPL